MPYFRWVGTDCDKVLRSGSLVARCKQSAYDKLGQENITVISVVQEKNRRSISHEKRACIVRHISFLLQSGLSVPIAFQTVAAILKDRSVALELADCAQAIEHGFAIDQACAYYPRIFDAHFCTLVSAGTATGSLVESLHMLADYYDFMASLTRSVRLSLFMPVLTLAFFICVMVLFVVFVVPRFESVFQSIGQEPQGFARALFKVSYVLGSWTGVLFFVSIFLSVFVLWRFWASRVAREWRDFILFWTPGVRVVVRQAGIVTFVQSCALLLKGHVPLVQALEHAGAGVSNCYMRELVLAWAADVSAGQRWSDVLRSCEHVLPVRDLQAVVTIGEQSGTLAHVVSYVSLLYATQFKQRLRLVSRAIQPLLLVFLGLCVAGFILALYIPLLSLSDSVV